MVFLPPDLRFHLPFVMGTSACINCITTKSCEGTTIPLFHWHQAQRQHQFASREQHKWHDSDDTALEPGEGKTHSQPIKQHGPIRTPWFLPLPLEMQRPSFRKSCKCRQRRIQLSLVLTHLKGKGKGSGYQVTVKQLRVILQQIWLQFLLGICIAHGPQLHQAGQASDDEDA